jgi:hypothetical protein
MAQRVGQLTDAIPAQLIGFSHAQSAEAFSDDLALLAEGARHHRDFSTARGVVRDGHTIVDGLVIGMGMYEQKATYRRHQNTTV